MKRLLVYGAYGYTGRLIIDLAGSYGLSPILGGRNQTSLSELARENGLESRAFPLDDPGAVDAGLTGINAVLHCAGPFSQTSRPMADACLRNHVHYLDITGEIEVMEALAERDAEARAASIMMMPGTGFDVVPSDCLALYLKEQLPTATHLMLGIRGSGPLSHGTATTMVEHRSRGGLIRRNGKLERVPTAWRTRSIDYGDGKMRTAMTIPWGDVATAYYTTGIPNIEVYAAVPRAAIIAAKASRYAGALLATSLVKDLLKRRIESRPRGPDAEELQHGASFVWGRVEDGAGRVVEGRVRGPNGYLLTAHSALIIARRVLSGDSTPGFQTPARRYGSRLILEVPGASMTL